MHFAQPRRVRTLTLALACLISALALTAIALPSAASARVPTYQVGDEPVFRFTTQAASAKKYGVFLTIASQRRTRRYGRLQRTKVGHITQMTYKGRGRYRWTTPDRTFPDWFMMKAGTYYFQMEFADCSAPGCIALSRIRKFKVV